MRTLLLPLALLSPALTLRAQSPATRLVPRHLSNGVQVSLPSSWHTLTASQHSKVMEIVDTTLQRSQDSLLKAALRNGTPVTLLIEADPDDPGTNVNLNAAPAPGTRANAFEGLSPTQVPTAFEPLCHSFRSIVAQAGFRTISCGPTELASAAGRIIALTRVVRTGPGGFVTVRLAQFPDRDVVYTLTLTAPQAADSQYEPLFTQMYRSIVLPAP